MTRVKFIRFGSSTACGNFQPGDMLSCSESLAQHFVNELKVAVYVINAAPAVAAEPVVAEQKPRRGRAK